MMNSIAEWDARYNYLDWDGSSNLPELIEQEIYPFVLCFYSFNKWKQDGCIDMLYKFVVENYDIPFLMIESAYNSIFKKYNVTKIPTILIVNGSEKSNLHYFTDEFTEIGLVNFFKSYLI